MKDGEQDVDVRAFIDVQEERRRLNVELIERRPDEARVSVPGLGEDENRVLLPKVIMYLLGKDRKDTRINREGQRREKTNGRRTHLLELFFGPRRRGIKVKDEFRVKLARRVDRDRDGISRGSVDELQG